MIISTCNQYKNYITFFFYSTFLKSGIYLIPTLEEPQFSRHVACGSHVRQYSYGVKYIWIWILTPITNIFGQGNCLWNIKIIESTCRLAVGIKWVSVCSSGFTMKPIPWKASSKCWWWVFFWFFSTAIQQMGVELLEAPTTQNITLLYLGYFETPQIKL